MSEQRKCLRRREDVVATRVSSGEGILLDLASRMYYTVNAAGMRLWEALDGRHTLDEYRAVGGDAAAEFLDGLVREGLVETAPEENVPPLPITVSLGPEESPSFTRHQPLAKVTVFTAATAGGATFF